MSCVNRSSKNWPGVSRRDFPAELFVTSFFLSTPVATVAWILKTEAGLENSDDDEDGL
jgi:hypothetical protein